MARVNLSMDDKLFELLVQDSNKHNCSVNVFIISLLEKLYKQEPFNYEMALATLETEAKAYPIEKDFTLADLPSFQEISVAKAEKAGLKPSIIRARLGKQFNIRVQNGKVGDVVRSTNEKGNLIFISRSAVYIRKPKAASIQAEEE